MKLLFKLFFGVAILGGGSYYIIRQTPPLRQRTVEIINPSAKAHRLTLELRDEIAALSIVLDQPVNPIERAKTLARQAIQKMEEIAELGKERPGYIREELAKVVAGIGPSSPKQTESPRLAISETGVMIPCTPN